MNIKTIQTKTANVKTQIEVFYISCFSQKKQTKKLTKIINKRMAQIIDRESEYLPVDKTRLCHLYLTAFNETIDILLYLDNKKEIKRVFDVMGVALDAQAFHYYLPEITEVIHVNHPTYMGISRDLMKVMYK